MDETTYLSHEFVDAFFWLVAVPLAVFFWARFVYVLERAAKGE